MYKTILDYYEEVLPILTEKQKTKGFLAMDGDGEIYWFPSAPTLDYTTIWYSENSEYICTNQDLACYYQYSLYKIQEELK